MLTAIIVSIALLVILYKALLFVISIPLVLAYSSFCKKRSRYAELSSEHLAAFDVDVEKSASLKSILRSYVDDYVNVFLLRRVSFFPSMHVRMFIFRHIYLMDIGESACIYKGFEVRNPASLTIGKGTSVGDGAHLDARKGLVIGDNVNISTGVQIYTLQHDYRNPYFACNDEHCGKVSVGDRVWLGPGSIILPGVSIGEGAVIGAGAVVTKSVPAYSVYAGVPAHKIADRPDNLLYTLGESHRHFL